MLTLAVDWGGYQGNHADFTFFGDDTHVTSGGASGA